MRRYNVDTLATRFGVPVGRLLGWIEEGKFIATVRGDKVLFERAQLARLTALVCGLFDEG